MKNQENNSELNYNSGHFSNRFGMKRKAGGEHSAECMEEYSSTARNPQHSDSPKDEAKMPEKKPWPMSWVIIAILLYLLFQVSYVALKPTPSTVGMSYKYDRAWLMLKQEGQKQRAALENFPKAGEQPQKGN